MPLLANPYPVLPHHLKRSSLLSTSQSSRIKQGAAPPWLKERNVPSKGENQEEQPGNMWLPLNGPSRRPQRVERKDRLRNTLVPFVASPKTREDVPPTQHLRTTDSKSRDAQIANRHDADQRPAEPTEAPGNKWYLRQIHSAATSTPTLPRNAPDPHPDVLRWLSHGTHLHLPLGQPLLPGPLANVIRVTSLEGNSGHGPLTKADLPTNSPSQPASISLFKVLKQRR